MKKIKKPIFEINKLKHKTKKLHERNFNKFGFDLHPSVSVVSALLMLIFIGITLLNPKATNMFLMGLQEKITGNLNWFFVLSANIFLLFPIFLMVSKFGEIRLGGPKAKPEFSNFAWYSMLISAGMGIGLVFFGVAEPLFHANTILPHTNSTSQTQALATSFLHWGLHPWGIYSLISLALAFFAYNRGLPLSLRSVFYPVLKDRVFGKIGDIIDITAVVSCLFGLATSLGYGAQQINSGLNYLFNIPQNTTVQVIIITLITLVATLSVVSGVGKGVKILSELNIKIAGIFLIVMLFLGPTLFIFRSFGNSIGYYLNHFFELSFFSENGNSWQGSWTIFYWTWWISWSPFVGMFIARVSKGRTIREFIFAILIIPVLLSFIWFSTFGATAFYQNMITGGKLLEMVKSDTSTALFAMIQSMNIPNIVKTIVSVIGTFLVISFFVTSSDSGSLVVDNLTSGGKLESPIPQRIFWALTEGAIAVSLLVSGGNEALNALQTGVILSGLPFTIILLIMMYSLYLGLKTDLHKLKEYREESLIFDIVTTQLPSNNDSSGEDYLK